MPRKPENYTPPKGFTREEFVRDVSNAFFETPFVLCETFENVDHYLGAAFLRMGTALLIYDFKNRHKSDFTLPEEISKNKVGSSSGDALQMAVLNFTEELVMLNQAGVSGNDDENEELLQVYSLLTRIELPVFAWIARVSAIKHPSRRRGALPKPTTTTLEGDDNDYEL